MSLTEIKTAPYNIDQNLAQNDLADMLAQAKEQARVYNEGPMPLDEAAGMYDAQEFSKNLVLTDNGGRHTPRSSQLEANAPEETLAAAPIVNELLATETTTPLELTQKGLMSRLRSRLGSARESLKNVFNREAPTPAEKQVRRKALASVAGSIAVGLVMVAATPSAEPSQVIEKPASTSTTIARQIRTPQATQNIAKTTGQTFSNKAEVNQYISQHPKQAADLFTWISTTKAQNPAITDQEMSQQFHSYTKAHSTTTVSI